MKDDGRLVNFNEPDTFEVNVPLINKQYSEHIEVSHERQNVKDNKSTPTSSQRLRKKKQVIHHNEYTFVGYQGVMAQLLSADFKLINVPKEFLSLTLKEGVKLIFTIQIDKTNQKRQQQELVSQQLRLLAEDEQQDKQEQIFIFNTVVTGNAKNV